MRRSSIFAFALLAGALASACTASRYQISDALQRYGMNPNEAGCAAEFLRGKLSVRQVDRLTDAARYYNADGPLTFGDLVRVAASIRDPDIALQVGASALACGIAADVPVPGF